MKKFIIILLSIISVSCTKGRIAIPESNVWLSIKADKYYVIDHTEIRYFFSFTEQEQSYTPSDSTVVKVLYNKSSYILTIPSNEASGYMLSSIKATDSLYIPKILSAKNNSVIINF